MTSAGQVVALTIEKPAAGGRMIARVDGRIVLVAGAIPGERVTARIERVGKGVAYAQTLSIDEASPDRREPYSDPLCGGCLYAHIAYPRQLDIKARVIADALARIGRLTLASAVAVAPSPAEGYRMRSRLHVRGGRLGFFREGTHDLCDARATRQLLPATSDVLERLATLLPPTAPDAVREVEVSENVEASQRAVHLDTVAELDLDRLAPLASSADVSGLSIGQPTGGVTTLFGDPHVTDRLSIGGHIVALRRHVLGFFQGNRFLLRDLVAHVIDEIDEGSQVVDLYAGAGVFAVSAAVARGARVIAVEGDRVAAADLAANTRTAGAGVEAVHQPVETFVQRSRSIPDVLIVDPPRTGMSREAMEGAIGLHPRKVVYVSCDVATLARDARRLLDAGYTVQRVDAFDLFPNTPHVETVMSLTSSAPPPR